MWCSATFVRSTFPHFLAREQPFISPAMPTRHAILLLKTHTFLAHGVLRAYFHTYYQKDTIKPSPAPADISNSTSDTFETHICGDRFAETFLTLRLLLPFELHIYPATTRILTVHESSYRFPFLSSLGYSFPWINHLPRTAPTQRFRLPSVSL